MLSSCTKEEVISSSGEVRFSSESLLTRLDAAGTTWKTGDSIGISMDGSEYQEYVSTTDGATTTFTAAEGVEPFVYPRSGEVTFNAYYPFQRNGKGAATHYVANLLDQSEGIGEHDFMVATESGCEDGDVVNFEFNHALSKISIEVKCNKDSAMTSLEGLKVSIADMPIDAVYYLTGELYSEDVNVSNTMSLYTTFTDEGNAATAESIINLFGIANKTVTFTLGGKPYTETITLTPVAGTLYKYSATIGNEEATFDSNLPSIGGWFTTAQGDITGLE